MLKSHAKTKVMVVDDSPLIRTMICDAIATSGDLEVVGQAADGAEALRLVTTLKPNVITLDVEMPKMSGLEALDKILEVRPTPVVMFSSLTERAAAVTLDALERGAVDYIAKPTSNRDLRQVLEIELLHKLRVAAAVNVSRLSKNTSTARKTTRAFGTTNTNAPAAGGLVRGVVAIGISTGGPPVLTDLFQELEPQLPPILVVQHMPEAFTKPFADRLNNQSALSIKEAETGDRLANNHVYIARGGNHMELVRRGTFYELKVFKGDPVAGHQPSVDVMMASVAKCFSRKTVGLIMTGMGRDGVDGCKALFEAGGHVIGQDRPSSSVYGMNKAAFEAGWVHEQCNLNNCVPKLLDAIGNKITPHRRPVATKI